MSIRVRGSRGDPDEFVRLCNVVLEDAQVHRYRKADGFVYAPIPGCPCAYGFLGSVDAWVEEVVTEGSVPPFVRAAILPERSHPLD